jgi:hypothetical protein
VFSRLTFRPCRTSSSDRMSKVPKSAPHCCSAATTLLLKPQRGASGEPCTGRSRRTAGTRHAYRAAQRGCMCVRSSRHDAMWKENR